MQYRSLVSTSETRSTGCATPDKDADTETLVVKKEHIEELMEDIHEQEREGASCYLLNNILLLTQLDVYRRESPAAEDSLGPFNSSPRSRKFQYW